MRGFRLGVVCALAAALCACAASAPARSDATDGSRATVVFVCEHGAAKSVVAAAYFNRIAEQRHLPLHAVARGLTPQETLSVSATDGLRADGLSTDLTQPIALNRSEAQAATHVVTFLPLPGELTGDRRPLEWDDVPATGDGDARARDAIATRVEALVDELAQQTH